MHNRFDVLVKTLGTEALDGRGTGIPHAELTTEARYADILFEPDPAHLAKHAELGLLGRLTTCACLLEVYSQAVQFKEFRNCLTKHLIYWHRRVRAWKKKSRKKKAGQESPRTPTMSEDDVAPFLWIIAAGVPKRLLKLLSPVPAPDWPQGVYLFVPEALRIGFVVASQLPRDSSTLLIRLMAGGPKIGEAVADAAALPPGSRLRTLVEPALIQFQELLEKHPSSDRYEKEFLVAMLKGWDANRQKGREEGREEGAAEAQARAVLTVLRVRNIAVPDAARERILAERDLALLERWLERATVATAIGQVLDKPTPSP